MDLDRLRSDTREEHEATESVMPLMDATLTRPRYADVLKRLYPVVAGWEAWAAENAPRNLQEMVKARQRAVWIADDLRFLGLRSSELRAFASDKIPRVQSRAGFLGAMYVMEGSTLGGQYIARHVEEVLGLTPGVGNAYFRGYGERTGEMWRAFKAILVEVPDEETETVIAAAKGTFAVFRVGMATAAG